MPTISFPDFQKLELRVGTILAASPVAGSEKLLKLSVDFAESAPEAASEHVALSPTPAPEADPAPAVDAVVSAAPTSTPRQILAGIAKMYAPEALVGRQFLFAANLEPRKLMGLESQGMILAASLPDGSPVLVSPLSPVAPGSLLH